MDENKFRCPRCGHIRNKKEGVIRELPFSLYVHSEDFRIFLRYYTLHTATFHCSKVYFCDKCNTKMDILMFLFFILYFISPTLICLIISVFFISDLKDAVQLSVVLGLLIGLGLLRVANVVYKSFTIKKNKKYIDDARKTNAIVYE